MTAPIACDLSGLDEAQRKQLFSVSKSLLGDVRSVKKTEQGYDLLLRDATLATLADVSVFLAYDSVCCSFIRHGVSVEVNGNAWLHLHGDEAVQQFLRAELGPLLSSDLRTEL